MGPLSDEAHPAPTAPLNALPGRRRRAGRAATGASTGAPYTNQCTWGPHDKNGEGIIPRAVLLHLSPESGSELRNKRPNLISLAKLETSATDLLLFILSG